MKQNNRSLSINLYTIIAVYFLILVGGIVRSMGAGMGCPDWPKCFGSYVPPASASELPANYEDIYVSSRVEKNERLAATLLWFGWEDLAQRVTNDPSIGVATYFDTQKAWVEYINRLVGVIIGFLVIMNMIFTLKYIRTIKWVAILGVLSFVLVVFQGWIGSLVVSTNLLPGFISFHMILALLLVALLLTQRYLMSSRDEHRVTGGGWLLVLLVLFTIQIIFGVQVREEIDVIKHGTDIDRSGWLDQLGLLFYVHRSYSLLLTAIVGYVVYLNWKHGTVSAFLKSLVVIICIEIGLGVIMAYFSFPAFAQPLHLLLGTMAFGVIFYLFLYANSYAQKS